MPTVFTAGILDGEITTFPQFAKKCMRAFGATIHMKEEGWDAEYEESTPSDYHLENLEDAKRTLKEVELLSDEAIISQKKEELTREKKYYTDKIKKANNGLKNMNAILKEVNAWQPPTVEHTGIKNFMADQILKTIDVDCNIEYTKKELGKIKYKLISLDAKTIKSEIIAKAIEDIGYHSTKYNEEVEKCKQSNKWVVDLINSLGEVKKKA